MGRDERGDDRGREARRGDSKGWLHLVGIALTVAAILWRGGQMTEKLDNVVGAVNTVSSQVATQQIDQAALRVKVEGHDKEIANHENRIVRIENRDRRER